MIAKTDKKPAKKEDEDNIAPFPVNTLEAYQLAADTLETDIWNLVVPEIVADFPIDWVVGILERIKIEVQEISYMEDDE